MEHLKRHQRVWNFLRRLLSGFVKRKLNYDPEVCTPEGPVLVLANHNTDWDPILLGMAFPTYMSYVASEHIFRWGFIAKVLIWLFAPIARLKGTTAGDTALTMVRRLKKGVNVAMFAEGNRSFDGLTCPILPATGKLARSSGAGLVTYRFDGGYLTSPRWSGSKMRRGKITGRVVNVYTPEQLKAMTADEVNAAINRDLFVDAFAVQRQEMVPFKAKKPAEHLERVLCLCPKCGKLSLKSKDDKLFCDCGFSVRYNAYGFFEGEDAPFDNLTDWDKDQAEKLCALADDAGDGAIFSDDGMVLTEILPGHETAQVGAGAMTLYRDRLECCGKTFPLDAISGFALHGAQTVDMSSEGHSYELKSQQVRCTRKYLTVIEHIRHHSGV